MCVSVCLCVYTCIGTHTYTCVYKYTYILSLSSEHVFLNGINLIKYYILSA